MNIITVTSSGYETIYWDNIDRNIDIFHVIFLIWLENFFSKFPFVSTFFIFLPLKLISDKPVAHPYPQKKELAFMHQAYFQYYLRTRQISTSKIIIELKKTKNIILLRTSAACYTVPKVISNIDICGGCI